MKSGGSQVLGTTAGWLSQNNGGVDISEQRRDGYLRTTAGWITYTKAFRPIQLLN
jgi:hypothetical protein